MMIRRFSVFLILIMGFALTACGDRPVHAPDDNDAEEALRTYYQTAGNIRNAEIHVKKDIDNRKEDREGTRPDGKETVSGPEDPKNESADEDCTDVRIVIDDGDTDTRREIVRLSCDMLDEAETTMRRGIKNLGEMVESFASVIEREFSTVIGLDHASVLACIPATDRPGYICDITAALAYSDGKSRERFVTARFVKGRDGWVALDVED